MRAQASFPFSFTPVPDTLSHIYLLSWLIDSPKLCNHCSGLVLQIFTKLVSDFPESHFLNVSKLKFVYNLEDRSKAEIIASLKISVGPNIIAHTNPWSVSLSYWVVVRPSASLISHVLSQVYICITPWPIVLAPPSGHHVTSLAAGETGKYGSLLKKSMQDLIPTISPLFYDS